MKKDPVFDRVFSFKTCFQSCFEFVSVARLQIGGKITGKSAQKRGTISWKFRFESEALVIACTVGHLE